MPGDTVATERGVGLVSGTDSMLASSCTLLVMSAEQLELFSSGLAGLVPSFEVFTQNTEFLCLHG